MQQLTPQQWAEQNDLKEEQKQLKFREDLIHNLRMRFSNLTYERASSILDEHGPVQVMKSMFKQDEKRPL